MALKIRLRRMGRRNAPTYRVVVAESSMPRDGRIVENLGHYNPRTEPATLVVERNRALYWIERGAVPTETAKALLKRAGIFRPEAEAAAMAAAAAEAAEKAKAEKAAKAKAPAKAPAKPKAEAAAAVESPAAEAAPESPAAEAAPAETTGVEPQTPAAAEEAAPVAEAAPEVEAAEAAADAEEAEAK